MNSFGTDILMGLAAAVIFMAYVGWSFYSTQKSVERNKALKARVLASGSALEEVELREVGQVSLTVKFKDEEPQLFEALNPREVRELFKAIQVAVPTATFSTSS